MHIHSVNDELSDDIKKKFMLPLTIELQDHKEKVFHKVLHKVLLLLVRYEFRIYKSLAGNGLLLLNEGAFNLCITSSGGSGTCSQEILKIRHFSLARIDFPYMKNLTKFLNFHRILLGRIRFLYERHEM